MAESATRIRFTWPGGEATAKLDDTPGARAVLDTLPASATANIWGDEVYFRVSAKIELEPDAREVVDPGTVCFWVQGGALALPFGPTPASHGDECRLVTRVNVLGRLEGDPRVLASVRSGDPIKVARA